MQTPSGLGVVRLTRGYYAKDTKDTKDTNMLDVRSE
jgi:hypothetical protein